jgi:hypothetical protein
MQVSRCRKHSILNGVLRGRRVAQDAPCRGQEVIAVLHRADVEGVV